MDERQFMQYEPFFGKWYFSRELGKGAYGHVYEVYCDEDGVRQMSALKVMHIPSEEALQLQIEQQPNMDAVRNYFLAQVGKIMDEINILKKCQGHPNIVRYEEHSIIQNGENGIGWDILIRMEELYPISPYFSRPGMSQLNVLRMWLDIANALCFCEQENIIHRDIKPANILVSLDGRFKLSDFGAARKSMEGGEASTRVGTERYMAPEVYKGQKYDKRADYYSLGCVIYFYLNYRRHPFLPPYPRKVDAREYDMADTRRIRGE